MKDEISEMALQAFGSSINNNFILEYDAAMFAELIVKRCLILADNIRDECDKDGENQQALGAEWVALSIARHFEVEE